MDEQQPGWRFLPLGEAALLVEASQATPLANRAVLALATAVEQLQLEGLSSVTPAINSLLISYNPLLLTRGALEQQVRHLLADLQPAPELPPRVVAIPVIYGGEAGPDLNELAGQLGLTPAQVVAQHCGQVYRVMMIGFAPGFPYLGPLPASLNVPRRSTPRTAVPAGSVALAAGLTGIYPARLPGGWHLIGLTDVRLFEPHAQPPSLLQPGDGVRFVARPEGITP